jgi:hypothetical protein
VGEPVAFAERWATELDVGLFGLQRGDAALIDARAVAQRTGRIFVVTLGPEGALALGRGARIACAARPVERPRHDRRGRCLHRWIPVQYVRGGDVPHSLARWIGRLPPPRAGHLGSFEVP